MKKTAFLLLVLGIFNLANGQVTDTLSNQYVKGFVSIYPEGVTSTTSYNGSLIITKPEYSGQYINLNRSNQNQWSIGTIYNTNTFAIGQSTLTDASFTNPSFNILQTGEVGIGVKVPLEKLHVEGAIRGNQIGGALRVKTDFGFIDLGPQASRISNINTDMDKFLFNRPIYSESGVFAANNNSSLFLQSGGSTRVTILNNGKVGIGVPIPDFKLDVDGSVNLVNDLIVTGSGQSGNLGGTVQIVNSSKSLPGQAKKWTIFNSGGTTNGNSLQFWAYDNTDCQTTGCKNRFTIMDNGNVGIGTTKPNPISKLDVEGNIYINASTNSNHIYWEKNNMTMGTVVGDYSHNVFMLQPGGSTQGNLFSRFEMYNANQVNSATSYVKNVQISTDGDTFFNGGNVGIGTSTNIDHTLTVNGSFKITNGENEFSYSGFSDIVLKDKSRGDAGSGRAIVHDGGNILTLNYASDFNGGTKIGSNVFFKDDGNSYINVGNLGIGTGTTVPQYKLDVKGSIGTNDLIVTGQGPEIGGTISIVNTAKTTSGQASTWKILNMTGDHYGNSLQFWAYDNIACPDGLCNNRFTIMDNGNVGIGKMDPKSKLHVEGDITMPFGFKIGAQLNDSFNTPETDNQTLGHYSMGWFGDNRTKDIGNVLWMSGYGGIKLFTHGEQQVIVNYQGKMGIGLTKPDEFLSTTPIEELLTVNGTIHAREVKIDLTTDLADYVFDESYKLMPLNQVEQFVKTNSHLPEIPSASEVSKNGMNIGEMQNKLLQKIEELTLYVIEQQKKIEILEKKLK